MPSLRCYIEQNNSVNRISIVMVSSKRHHNTNISCLPYHYWFFKLEPQAGFEPTSRFRIRITNPAESSTVSLGQIEFSFDDKGTSILQLKSIYWGLHVPPTELYMSVPCVACPIYKSQPTSSLVGFNNTLAIFLARAVGQADRRDSHSSYSFKAV